jgi:histidinol-phosphate aminotransferase
MDDHDHIGRTLANNAEQSEIVAAGLAQIGFRVVPTWANFLYCELPQDATDFARALRAEGVSVRPLGAWGAPKCIRVSIGTPEQNAVFLQAAQKISAKSGVRTRE